MPSRGYLVLAQNGLHDYVRLAYGLALSIRLTQREVNRVSLIVPKQSDVPDNYRWAFDQIIEFPWGDRSGDAEWKLHNKYLYYYVSPYAETVILDADMLFPADVSAWWARMALQDVVATTQVLTYRREIVESDFYRKTFTQNGLPNIYTGFFFFKKSALAAELFNQIDLIMKDWKPYYESLLRKNTPDGISADVCYALAIKMMDVEDLVVLREPFPTFVHMKSQLQGWGDLDVTENWTKHIPVFVNDRMDVKIGHHLQVEPLHYHVKSFLTDSIIAQYEEALGA